MTEIMGVGVDSGEEQKKQQKKKKRKGSGWSDRQCWTPSTEPESGRGGREQEGRGERSKKIFDQRNS